MRPALLLALALGCVGTLGACSDGTVTVPTPTPSTTAVSQACDELDASLPETLAGQTSRTTSPDSPLTAAWGDPAITLTCGVPQPSALRATSQVVSVNGVTWFPEQLTAGYRFTTVGRTADVQVDVPDHYAPEAGVLTDIAGALKAADPKDR